MERQKIRDDIERNKRQMEKEIEEVNAYNPPCPCEPSFKAAFLAGLKWFAWTIGISGLNLFFAFQCKSNDAASHMFSVFTALAICFGTVASIIRCLAIYSTDKATMNKWVYETSDACKQEKIGTIKRKYETIVSNLEQYGNEKGSYSYWNRPPKVCLRCGSTNVMVDRWRGTYGLYRDAHIKCNDCGYQEFYL